MVGPAGNHTTRPVLPRFPTARRLRQILESPAGTMAAIGLLAVILGSGLKRFLVWDQVLLLERANPLAAALDLHPHTLRLMVMEPALVMGRYGWDPHAAFTVIGFGCIIATAMLLAMAADRCLIPSADHPSDGGATLRTAAVLGLSIPALAMNGRLLPAYLGLALVIALHLRWARPRHAVDRHRGWLVTGQALGILLSCVSSGTMGVVAGAVALFWIGQAVAGWRSWSGLARSTVISGLVLLTVLVLAFAGKALRFFGGDPWQVLSHGPGAVILGVRDHLSASAGSLVGTALATVLLLVVLGMTGWWAMRGRSSPHQPLAIRIPLALAVALGLCGWATLTMALPVVLMLALILVAEPLVAGSVENQRPT